MRVVIDTNSLESDELRIFLSANKNNLAVLPEHTNAELFKHESLKDVFASHAVLREFPTQVLVLRGNRYAAAVDPCVGAISNRFVDREATRGFPRFCEALAAAEQGNISYLRQFRERQRWAKERADHVEATLGDQSQSLAEIRQLFSDNDLKHLRSGLPLPPRARSQILLAALSLSKSVASSQSNKIFVPASRNRYNSFLWREALCEVVQMTRLVANGALRRAPAKARNDHFDNVFATFGTYFNGVMSNDMSQLSTQCIARVILRALGVRLAPDYIESGYILNLIK